VDYTGQTVAVIDRLTGEARGSRISSSRCWERAMTPMPRPPGPRGCPIGLAPTCGPSPTLAGSPRSWSRITCASFVHKPEAHEPDLNPTYQDLCAHYGVAVIPARVRRPRDKAKVEVGVQVVERWCFPRLRHAQFFSLGPSSIRHC
jgi:hypothetical protein